MKMIFQESFDERKITEKTDVWGFSYILLEMLTSSPLGTYSLEKEKESEYCLAINKILNKLSNNSGEKYILKIIKQGLEYDPVKRISLTEFYNKICKYDEKRDVKFSFNHKAARIGGYDMVQVSFLYIFIYLFIF